MSLRRFVSLMHGLGYASTPQTQRRSSEASRVLSQESLRSLPRSMMRYAPGEVSDG